MTIIFPFGEGKTEKIIFELLLERNRTIQNFREFSEVYGKSNFRNKIINTVKGQFTPNKNWCILVFRDVDHDEIIKDIVTSFNDIISVLIADWDINLSLQQHTKYSNIYMTEVTKSKERPGFRFVLHLADTTHLELPVSLRNNTSDGYVLALGLEDTVLTRFAQKARINTDLKSFRNLILSELPSKLETARINCNEDKDFLAAYLFASRFWVVHRNERHALLTNIILKRAAKYVPNLIERVFDTWLVAIEEAMR